MDESFNPEKINCTSSLFLLNSSTNCFNILPLVRLVLYHSDVHFHISFMEDSSKHNAHKRSAADPCTSHHKAVVSFKISTNVGQCTHNFFNISDTSTASTSHINVLSKNRIKFVI
jgi:hypothetical protein